MGLIKNFSFTLLTVWDANKVEILMTFNVILLSIVVILLKNHWSQPKRLKGPNTETVEDDDDDDVLVGSKGDGPDVDPEEAAGFVPFKPNFPDYTPEQRLERSKQFYEFLNGRRSVRFFEPNQNISLSVIKNIVLGAGTSPSGAHCQPWTYAVVSSLDLKSQIRKIIEAEEKINYERRMGQKWVDDLKSVGTTWKKPYLEEASHILIVFKQAYGEGENGTRKTHYYTDISVSISCGLLLAGIENAGLVTVTTTPLNAGPKLRALLNRPANEKVLILLPIGVPAKNAEVPNFTRKKLSDISAFY